MPQSHVRMLMLLLNASERMTKSRRKDLAMVKCKIAYAHKYNKILLNTFI